MHFKWLSRIHLASRYDRDLRRGLWPSQRRDTIGSLRETTVLIYFLDSYNVLSGSILHELMHIDGDGLTKHSTCCLSMRY